MSPLKQNTTIAQRLNIGFISIITILLCSIIITLWQIHKLNTTVDELALKQIPVMEASMSLLNDINEGSASLRGYLLTRNSDFAQDNVRIWQAQITPTLLKLQTYAREWMDKQDRALIDGISNKIQDVKISTDTVREAPNNTDAIKLFTESLAPKVNLLRKEIRYFTYMQNITVSKSIVNTKQSISRFILFEWCIMGIGLVLSISLSYRISKSLVEPIKRVVVTMNDIAEGRTVRTQTMDGPREIQLLGQSTTHLVNTLHELTQNITRIAEQQYDVSMTARSDEDKLIHALLKMTQALKENATYYANQIWLRQGINTLGECITKSHNLNQLCDLTLSDICRHLEAGVGALYLNHSDEKQLSLTATFSFVKRAGLSSHYQYGEGVIGQVAIEGKPISLNHINRQELVIQSGVTEEAPYMTYTFPLLDKAELIAVVELGFHTAITDIKLDYIRQIGPVLASSIHILDQKQLTETLLEKQQLLTKELTTQQEELKTSNEELETQAEELRTSEEELRVRDEEQRSLNQSLEERNQALEQQKVELENARALIQQRADELTMASQYKSEFLANMSHELRTPLNSILLLSKMLSDEKTSRLNNEDLESASVIHKSAGELLQLINDILDLSKVEAGKIKVESSPIDLKQLLDEIHKDFKHIAQEKNLAFNITLMDDVPSKIASDLQRLKQILRNLLSNAFKFTDNGHITLSVSRAKPDAPLNMKEPIEHILGFTVIDTGIGIPQDKQKDIFKTFYQCDGSTNRNYAGTGLGLSISAQLAFLLGGEIQVTSTSGEGSCFTLYIPEILKHSQSDLKTIPSTQPSFSGKELHLADVTSQKIIPSMSESHEKCLLIVEDDAQFSQILKTTCEKKGFKCICVKTGKDALKVAAEQVLLGILMDVNLPDLSGLVVVDKLKENETTKHIPVHFISGADKEDEAMKHGAVSYIMKPVTIEQLDGTIKEIEAMVSGKLVNLLIIEDDNKLSHTLKKLFEDRDAHVTTSPSGKKAIKLLKNNVFDCVILDLYLNDISGFDVLKQLQDNNIHIPPIIIYTGKELTEEETQLLEKYSSNIIIKSKASLDRLMDETLLFIHHLDKKYHLIQDLNSEKKQDHESKLIGKKILLVDDDIRNTFSLAKSLKVYGADILIAQNGKVAIEILSKETDISIILMDIMMPVMDGFETIKKIRSTKQFSDLPIIALTAKAMSQDREQCLAVGATDYMAKPVDVNKLLILLRAWM